ncbi:MAG: ZIP family metal transporter [Planctomycetota bacterium]|nr:ZIP family metal transporter [Planctomycetota bacterium]
MSIELLATIYAILIIAASIFGGIIPRFFKLTHARMQTALSFVAGVILGIGVLHLVPHGFQQFQMIDASRAIDRTVWWLLMGFLVMFFLQRLFHFHSHETPAEVEAGVLADSTCSHEDHDHSHHSHGHHEHSHHDHAHHDQSFTWAGVFFGLTLHSLVDGITLFAAIQAEEGHAHGWMVAGLGYFLAVFLHKPFDSLSIASLMMASGWSAGWRTAVNWIYSLVAPLGMLMCYFGLNQAGDYWSTTLLAGTLCFAAGTCVCISTSDLLPELQFHSHDRLKLSIALLLGLGLAWGLVFIENQGHDHHVDRNGSHHEHHGSDHDHTHGEHNH